MINFKFQSMCRDDDEEFCDMCERNDVTELGFSDLYIHLQDIYLTGTIVLEEELQRMGLTITFEDIG